MTNESKIGECTQRVLVDLLQNVDLLEARLGRRSSLIPIPDDLWNVRYNADHFPGAPRANGVEGGANCQQYAYTVLRRFGFQVPNFRSSELSDDTLHTTVPDHPALFDLMLFSDRPESFGAHIGLFAGNSLVLHLSRKIGVPAVETVDQLQAQPQYRYLTGIKRVLSRIAPEAGVPANSHSSASKAN